MPQEKPERTGNSIRIGIDGPRLWEIDKHPIESEIPIGPDAKLDYEEREYVHVKQAGPISLRALLSYDDVEDLTRCYNLLMEYPVVFEVLRPEHERIEFNGILRSYKPDLSKFQVVDVEIVIYNQLP